MSNKNLKAIITGFIVIVIGIASMLLDLFVFNTPQGVYISIGCSLIASGGVILLQVLVVDREKENEINKWKITKIYETRAQKSEDSDPKLKNINDRLDVVAFGIRSFRNRRGDDVLSALNNGANVRILTMNPGSQFISEREKEENDTPGHIKDSINDMVEWARELNSKSRKGKIEVRGYNCMTLDFYWRMDNELYIGPYWKNKESQQTITYKFEHGGKGFEEYTKYFDSLWESNDNTELLAPSGRKTKKANK